MTLAVPNDHVEGAWPLGRLAQEQPRFSEFTFVFQGLKCLFPLKNCSVRLNQQSQHELSTIPCPLWHNRARRTARRETEAWKATWSLKSPSVFWDCQLKSCGTAYCRITSHPFSCWKAKGTMTLNTFHTSKLGKEISNSGNCKYIPLHTRMYVNKKYTYFLFP